MSPTEVLTRIDDDVLVAWLRERRWFASKAREIAHVNVLDTVVLDPGEPMLVLACLEARFHAGTHEIYQVLLGLRPSDQGWDEGVIADAGGTTVYEALCDPEAAAELVRLLAEGEVVEGEQANVAFHWADHIPAPRAGATVQPLGVEQSNSSVLIDDAIVLKLFRRMEAGENPELEMLGFLTDHGFPNVPALGGFYDYSGELMDARLGVAARYVPGRDGWLVALDELATDPEGFLPRLRELGEVVGRMHTVLGSDPSDSTFVPEEASVEMLSLLTATVDEEIQRVFDDLPADRDALEPIVARGEEVRDTLRILSQVGVGGRMIRTHGDLHLGQTLLAEDPDLGWVILDFEGEPARPLVERRRKRSPLRDVAGMLRSISYVAWASEIQRGTPAPEGWEERARAELLDGYFAAVDPGLVPPPQTSQVLLSIFELEKAVYELRYELDNRPDWVGIPVAGIAGILEGPVEA